MLYVFESRRLRSTHFRVSIDGRGIGGGMMGEQIPPLAFDYGRFCNMLYIDWDEYLQSLSCAFQEIGEQLSEVAQALEALCESTLVPEPKPQYPFVKEIGNIDYCKGICRKPIQKARSCC